MKKGFLLSMDVIISAGLLLLLTLFISSIPFTYSSPEMRYQRLYYAGKDILTVIGTLKLGDVDTNVTQLLLNDGIIEPDDLERTVLDTLGSLWASSNATHQMYAKNLTEDIFDRTLSPKLGYEILIDGSSVYRKNDTYVDYVSRLSTIQSGYEVGRPVSGYVARAWATKIRKNTTDVFPFHIEGAGNEGGDFEAWKRLSLNTSEIINATLYVSVHYGRNYNEFEALTVNGIDVRNSIVWLHEEEDMVGTGAFGIVDVTKNLTSGINEIYIRLSNAVYNSHIHPGMRLEVTYSTEVVSETTVTRKERVYFDHVVTQEAGNNGGGAWAMASYHIPNNVTVRSVVMHFRGDQVEDVGGRQDVRVYFNSTLYDQRNPLANKTVDLFYNFTNLSAPGTNMVLVQLNYRISYLWGMPYDDFFGDANTTIYSSPFTNPNGSSYIEVEYDLPPGKLYYGYIDVGISELFGGSRSNPKSYTTNFENKALEDAFLMVGQLFSDIVTVDVWPQGQPAQRVFTTPVSRMIPSKIYIDPSYLDVTKNNTVRVTDNCGTCDILPQSALQYHLWIPNSVVYGDVFETAAEALEDAELRLNQTLGKYAVATSIRTETSSISGVPSLWGPARFEIRVWS